MAKHEVIHLTKRGAEVLSRSLFNKGTAFTLEERDALGLHGLLPPKVSSLEDQIKRTYLNYSEKRTPLEKYQALMALMGRNELLFYQFTLRYAQEILPIIYTPTVGEAALHYSRIYFHQRGLYISYPLKDRLHEILENYSLEQVEVIVVTDGERILGLGDQGIGGMTIPIGKLALYTLFGGIHPARTLPIILDVGTNNQELLKDELDLGWNHPRIIGKEYDDFIEGFVEAVKRRYPKVLVQWEDFGRGNARRILEKFRGTLLSFNDDIQGTAAVTLGAIYAALQVKKETLGQQKIVIFGAGSAGTGIADMLLLALQEEGLEKEEALHRIFLIDQDGLIHFSSKQVSASQRLYSQGQAALENWDLKAEDISLFDTVKNAHPTILIGTSAVPGAFNKGVVQEMAKHVKRPVLFPLSNPTSRVECTPEEALLWTDGRAIIATGSPFPDVEYKHRKYKIGQCNNVYIFPGVGLGALAVRAKQITEGMFLDAAKTLASFSPALKDPTGSLFPDIEEVRWVSRQIALSVAKRACQEGVTDCAVEDIESAIENEIWEPHYPRFAIRIPHA